MFKMGKDANRRGDASIPAPTGTDKKMTRNSTPSILSADLVITGTLKTQGEVQLDGMIEGDIRAKSLTIGEKATVKGEILAETITVRGKVIGKMRARQIQLSATSHVEGDIVHSTLSMENGAYFEGQCHHDNDPLGVRKGPAKPSAPAASGNTQAANATVRTDTAMGAKKS